MTIRNAFLSVLFCSISAISASADESGKKEATEKLGYMTEPLAFGLDMSSFNKGYGTLPTGNRGELLSLFEVFLEKQEISLQWTADDLDRLLGMIQRDYDLAKAMESDLDDRYDDLKDEFEKLEEDIEDEKEDADLPKFLALKEQAAPIKSKRNVLRDYLEMEKPLLKKLVAANANPGDSRQREEACNTAVRILYSLFAGQMMDERGGKALPVGRSHKFQLKRNFVGRAEFNSVPYLPPHKHYNRIGPFGARNQANNLADPADPTRFVTADDMADMSHAAVAELDVSPTNPMWHTRKRMETDPPDTWRKIEKWVEAEVTKELLDSKKFKKKYPDFHYDLTKARKVLFWDEVKRTATSPKINVVDAFGMEWKLKWGEETALEPVGNRLRLLLGAKYADLTYAASHGSSHLLILASEMDRKLNPNDKKPITKAEFIQTMKESEYEFNVKPFIEDSGVITGENADTILKDLPEEASKKRSAKNLVGRVWIRFNESMVEVKHDVIKMGGPTTTNTEIPNRDRAIRQSMLMSMWMLDTDVKEDNHRSIWVKDFDGNEGSQYIEFFHDPGASFGGAQRSGEVNKLTVKRGNSGFLWVSPDGRTLLSNAFQVYRPEGWLDNAFTDHFAGAKHIVRLKACEIREVVRSSQMPDFYQETMAWRLSKRRDLIADFFGLSLPDSGAGDAPSIVIPLTTRSDRRAAAARYSIPLAEIEKDLVRTGYLPAENPAADTATPFNDVLLDEAKIQNYDDTVLLGIIRDFQFPSGFKMRLSRFFDDVEWESIRFKSK